MDCGGSGQSAVPRSGGAWGHPSETQRRPQLGWGCGEQMGVGMFGSRKNLGVGCRMGGRGRDGVDPGSGFRLQLSGGAIPGAWNVAGGAGQNQFQLTFKSSL